MFACHLICIVLRQLVRQMYRTFWPLTSCLDCTIFTWSVTNLNVRGRFYSENLHISIKKWSGHRAFNSMTFLFKRKSDESSCCWSLFELPVDRFFSFFHALLPLLIFFSGLRALCCWETQKTILSFIMLPRLIEPWMIYINILIIFVNLKRVYPRQKLDCYLAVSHLAYWFCWQH